jgi:hypothetical protein
MATVPPNKRKQLKALEHEAKAEAIRHDRDTKAWTAKGCRDPRQTPPGYEFAAPWLVQCPRPGEPRR